MDAVKSVSRAMLPLAIVAVTAFAAPASAVQIRVEITSLVPAGGTFLTPVWIGFHDGSFDLYDRGVAVGVDRLPPGLEDLAEDGVTAMLSADFQASAAGANGGIDATVPGPVGLPGPIDPGETTTSMTFHLDPVMNRYLSYASMVIPSNDAFVANGNPLAFPLFDDNGAFTGTDFIVLGSMVLDAGTEENTEEDAAFLNQTAADSGVDEDGVVELHPGFNGSAGNPMGLPVNILGTSVAGPNQDITIDATAGDFTQPDYQVVRLRVFAAAEPASLAVFAAGLVAFAAFRGTTRRSVRRSGALTDGRHSRRDGSPHTDAR